MCRLRLGFRRVKEVLEAILHQNDHELDVPFLNRSATSRLCLGNEYVEAIQECKKQRERPKARPLLLLLQGKCLTFREIAVE